ncbi:hypothetical protein EG68_02171 [Paragonimus skrjabini miyazakii]|uniref:Uncharacterized protein n=1 Tax=Paragonimus skrjabini miyazakii TaxID=59628 RepID=A0A8S9YZN9_9TREM|nr:hypothetical protein EG68_02171 [Paragonimus skrjabini miyazakii]
MRYRKRWLQSRDVTGGRGCSASVLLTKIAPSSTANTSSEDSSSCDSFGLRRANRIRVQMDLQTPAGSRTAFGRNMQLKHRMHGHHRAHSSERDYTSSSEQSCDTAIYIGSRGYRGQQIVTEVSRRCAKPTQTLIKSADETQSDTGENDQRKMQEGISSDTSSITTPKHALKENTDQTHAKEFGEHRAVHLRDGKRIMPRTNLHAWPRAAVKNAVETLSTQKEQWVDGPRSNFNAKVSSKFETMQTSMTEVQPVKTAMADKEIQSVVNLTASLSETWTANIVTMSSMPQPDTALATTLSTCPRVEDQEKHTGNTHDWEDFSDKHACHKLGVYPPNEHTEPPTEFGKFAQSHELEILQCADATWTTEDQATIKEACRQKPSDEPIFQISDCVADLSLAKSVSVSGHAKEPGLLCQGVPEIAKIVGTISHEENERPLCHQSSVKVKSFVKDWVQQHSNRTVISQKEPQKTTRKYVHTKKQYEKSAWTGTEHICHKPHSPCIRRPVDHSAMDTARGSILKDQHSGKIIPIMDGSNSHAFKMDGTMLSNNKPLFRKFSADNPPVLSNQTRSNFARIAEWVKSVSVETCESLACRPKTYEAETNSSKPSKSFSILPGEQSIIRGLTTVTASRTFAYRFVENTPITRLSVGRHSPILYEPKHFCPPERIQTGENQQTHGYNYEVSRNFESTRSRRGQSVPPSNLICGRQQMETENCAICVDQLEPPSLSVVISSQLPISLANLTVGVSANSADIIPLRRPDGASNPHLHQEQYDVDNFKRQENQPTFHTPFQTKEHYQTDKRQQRKYISFWNHLTRTPTRNAFKSSDHDSQIEQDPTAQTVSLFCAKLPTWQHETEPSQLLKSFNDRQSKSPLNSRVADAQRLRQRSYSFCSIADGGQLTELNQVFNGRKVPESNHDHMKSTTTKQHILEEITTKDQREHRTKTPKGRLSFWNSPLFGKRKQLRQDKETKSFKCISGLTDNGKVKTKYSTPKINRAVLPLPTLQSLNSDFTWHIQQDPRVHHFPLTKFTVQNKTIPFRESETKLRMDTVGQETVCLKQCSPGRQNPDTRVREKLRLPGNGNVPSSYANGTEQKNVTVHSSSGHGSECSSLLPQESSNDLLFTRIGCNCRHHQRQSQHHQHHHHRHHSRTGQRDIKYSPCGRRSTNVKTHLLMNKHLEQPEDSHNPQQYPDNTKRPSGCSRNYSNPNFTNVVQVNRGTTTISLEPAPFGSIDESFHRDDLADTSLLCPSKFCQTIVLDSKSIKPSVVGHGLISTRKGGGHTSSGYESILRDSEASSHADSTSGSSFSGLGEIAGPAVSGVFQEDKIYEHDSRRCSTHEHSNQHSVINNSEGKGFEQCTHVQNGSERTLQKSSIPLLDGMNVDYVRTCRKFQNQAPQTDVNMDVVSVVSCKTTTDMQQSVRAEKSTIALGNSLSASSSSSTSRRSRSAPPCSEDTSEETSSSPLSVRYVPPRDTEVPVYAHPSTVEPVESPLPSSQVVKEDDREMLCQIRYEKIYDLLAQQDALKWELLSAKEQLMVDPSTWNFDLHVAEQMDPDASGFLEALEKETEILRKRVDACKSHLMFITCFDSHPKASFEHFKHTDSRESERNVNKNEKLWDT